MVDILKSYFKEQPPNLAWYTWHFTRSPLWMFTNVSAIRGYSVGRHCRVTWWSNPRILDGRRRTLCALQCCKSRKASEPSGGCRL